MSKPTLLIVDDEKNIREGLGRALRKQYDVLLAADGKAALEQLNAHSVDAVLTDVRMPGMDGITLLKRIMARDPRPVVILLTAYGSIELAVEAIKLGAQNYLTKPVQLDHLDHVVRQALEHRRIREENETLHRQLDEKYGLGHIIGNSQALRQVFETVQQVAASKATALILGESGTGKELIAHAIHQLSPRARAPFIPVHCAALSEQLLESELFGHEKGAFTGAHQQRPGRLERADGGTLFLDEIGEIDAATQVKLLRVLEERKFERVGGQEPIEVDVRLVAATNRHLREMVDAGEFREDLYFRLNVVSITLPPLRERREDIPLLVRHFMDQFAEENGKQIEGLTAEAQDVLHAYDWPGNIRELRNVVERMVVLARDGRLGVRDLPPELREQPGTRPATTHQPGLSGSGPKPGSLKASERDLIAQALADQSGNRTRAAKQLGISRRTLHRKLNEYDLHDLDS